MFLAPILNMLKSPQMIFTVLIAGLITFLYIDKLHLEHKLDTQEVTIQTQKVDVTNLSKRVAQDSVLIKEVQDLMAQRTTAIQELANKVSVQSDALAEFRKTHGVESLKQIQKTQGNAGLENTLNLEFVNRLRCIENITKNPSVSCAN